MYNKHKPVLISQYESNTNYSELEKYYNKTKINSLLYLGDFICLLLKCNILQLCSKLYLVV